MLVVIVDHHFIYYQLLISFKNIQTHFRSFTQRIYNFSFFTTCNYVINVVKHLNLKDPRINQIYFFTK